MRPFITSSLIAVLSVSVFANYDYTITESDLLDSVTVSDTQSLLMTGGAIWYLTGKDYSTLEIKNTSNFMGAMNGIGYLALSDSSHLKFSSGYVYKFSPSGDATAVLSGGQIDEIWGYYLSADSEHIKIICQNATFNTTTKYLTGIWCDGSDFSIKLVDQSDYSSVFSNITILPEPTTMLLLAVGGLLIRRK